MSDDIYPLFDYVKQPIEKQAQRLIKDHFPGALTLVVEKSENTPDYITSNMNTVGIRVPNNETFAKICRSIEGRVLATTSANISGEAPALTYNEALNYIGDKVDLIIEDLGDIREETVKLREHYGFTRQKILQFSLDLENIFFIK